MLKLLLKLHQILIIHQVYTDIETEGGYQYEVNYKVILEDEDHNFVVSGSNADDPTPIYSQNNGTLRRDSNTLWTRYAAHKFQELGLDKGDVVGAFGIALNNDDSWRGSEEGLDNYNVLKFTEAYEDPEHPNYPLVGAVLSSEDADAMIKIKNTFTPADDDSWMSALSGIIEEQTEAAAPAYMSISEANKFLTDYVFIGSTQYQFEVTIAGVNEWDSDYPEIILSTALVDTTTGATMAPYKLLELNTNDLPYEMSEDMAKLSFDTYMAGTTDDDEFNKISIVLPFSEDQLKNFEICNNMLQPKAMENMDKIVNFCKPTVLDELKGNLEDLLSNGKGMVIMQSVFVGIWALKLIADIVLLVFACIGLPFSGAVVVRCVINVATDTIALVFTAIQLDTQLEDNENTAQLIELLKDYKTKCTTNYDQIKDYYTTIKTELSDYKNSLTPGDRVAHSTLVAETNIY